MASLRTVVAGEVRAHLARQRISGRQAAIRLGWTAPYLSRRLTGEIPFNVADLEALAVLLDVPVTVFFERSPHLGPALSTMPLRIIKPGTKAPLHGLAAAAVGLAALALPALT